MDLIKTSSYYKYGPLVLSVALFTFHLFFTLFYTGTKQAPVSSISFFLVGWTVAYNGHFCWYANFFFSLSILSKVINSNISVSLSKLFSLIALLISISFLAVDRDWGRTISGYGWGYYIWVLSIGIFAIETILPLKRQHENKQSLNGFVGQLIWIVITASVFGFYFYFSTNGPNLLIRKRNKLFENVCSSIVEKVYKSADNVNGIYIEPYLGVECHLGFFEKSWSYINDPAISLIVNNNIFVERKAQEGRNDDMKFPFVRKYMNISEKKYTETPIDTLESNYNVVSKSLTDPESIFNIQAMNVKIIHSKTGEIIAETGFAISENDNKFCGRSTKNYFSTNNFIKRSLKLK